MNSRLCTEVSAKFEDNTADKVFYMHKSTVFPYKPKSFSLYFSKQWTIRVQEFGRLYPNSLVPCLQSKKFSPLRRVEWKYRNDQEVH